MSPSTIILGGTDHRNDDGFSSGVHGWNDARGWGSRGLADYERTGCKDPGEDHCTGECCTESYYAGDYCAGNLYEAAGYVAAFAETMRDKAVGHHYVDKGIR